MYHKQMKHINVRYHKIRQRVMDDRVIDLTKINTKKNPADMMMKIISMGKKHDELSRGLFYKRT